MQTVFACYTFGVSNTRIGFYLKAVSKNSYYGQNKK